MVMNIKMILAQIKPSFVRLEQFFQLEEEPCYDSILTVGQPEEIRIENLSFGYEGRKILENISLTIQKGECIAIIIILSLNCSRPSANNHSSDS